MALTLSLIGVPIVLSPFLAIFFFLFFNKTQAQLRLIIPRNLKTSMQIAIAVTLIWIIGRLIAIMIPGGGVGYMINHYSKVTVLPSTVALFIFNSIVLFKSYGKMVGNIFLILFIIASVARFSLPHREKHTYEKEWKKACESAKDEFDLQGEKITNIMLYSLFSHNKWKLDQEGEMREGEREEIGKGLLKRGIINEYDFFNKREQYNVSYKDGHYVRKPINTTDAKYMISYNSVNIRPSYVGKKFYLKRTISITNQETGKVVANRIQFIDPVWNSKTWFEPKRSCAQIYNGRISTLDFVEVAIKKSRE